MTSAGRPFVVTGSARSGTSFMAKLLTSSGHECGHERLFRPDTSAVPEFRKRRGDASWLAAPFVDQLPAGTIVFHQLRHPLHVLRSMMGFRFLAQRPSALRWARFHAQVRGIQVGGRVRHPGFDAYALRHCPSIAELSDPLSRCARYWVDWNRKVERAASLEHLRYLRYRVEDVDEQLLARMLDLLGDVSTTAETRRRALAEVGTGTNSRQRASTIRLSDIPSGDLRGELAELAGAYSYM